MSNWTKTKEEYMKDLLKMDPVQRLRVEYSIDEETARRAWAACCNGAAIAELFQELDPQVDPLDGKHEEIRKEIESGMVAVAISE